MIERITTAVPYPRGLEMVDLDGDGSEELIVLARGRVRDAGGVSAEVNDRAGTIFIVDPTISEAATGDDAVEQPSDAVRANATVLAEPVGPLKLWDRSSNPPEADTATDRPYCSMRFHAPTQSFYLCAFSGIDLPDARKFSKNPTDAILRYDLRTRQWYEIDRHTNENWDYPQTTDGKQHGFLKGPDNCIAVADKLYAVGKDNSALAMWDLTALKDDPSAEVQGEVVFSENLPLKSGGTGAFRGYSGLAVDDGYLYISCRTSGEIFRVGIDEATGELKQPVQAEIVAQFTAYDPATKITSDVTDIGFDDQGRLYVVAAKPAAVHRFAPVPANVYDGTLATGQPWLPLAEMLGRKTKSENVLAAGGYLYITSGDGYGYADGSDGTVYRVKLD